MGSMHPWDQCIYMSGVRSYIRYTVMISCSSVSVSSLTSQTILIGFRTGKGKTRGGGVKAAPPPERQLYMISYYRSFD